MLNPLHELTEEFLEFHSCKQVPEAHVRPKTKGYVRILCPGYTKRLRHIENLFISIGGGIEHQNGIPCPDRLSSEFLVGDRGSYEVSNGRYVAKNLIDGAIEQHRLLS